MLTRVVGVLRRCLVGGVCFGVVFAVAAGCGDNTPEKLKGFKRLAGGSYMQLVQLGEKPHTAKPGDYVSLQLRYATWRDSVFFSGTRQFQLVESVYKGSIDDCFSMLSEGDSAVFYIDAYQFFHTTLASTLPHYIDSGELLRIDTRMISIRDSSAFSQQQEAFLQWISDFGKYEETQIHQFLNKQHASIAPVDSLYYIPLRGGSGSTPKNGDTITFDFEGRFLTGKYFDSTKQRNEPFVFVLGQKWQVIDGLERAVRMMRRGEKALFVFPSGIAFGQEGSSTGIVPPFTPVVFEVEILDIKEGVQRDAQEG